MNCLEVKKNLSLYLENALRPIEAQVVKEHLASCPSCQQELNALQKSWELLNALEDIQPQANYISRFWTELSLRKTWKEKVFEALPPLFLKRTLAPVAVAVCLVLAMSVFAFHHYQSQKSEQMMASLSEEDLEILENIELAENLDLIEDLDVLQDMDVVEELDNLEASQT